MSFRVLHLSDIHFSTKPSDERIIHTDVRDRLLDDLRDQIVPKSGKIDKILIAGDIAFSGKREEYEEAAEWLERVTTICGCKRTDVLTVPGNHDVDRKLILPATKLIHRRLRNCSMPEAKKELVDLAEQKDGTLTDKLSDYQTFASSYGCQFESPSRPLWNHLISLGNDCMLKFVGLTTVQVCDSEDQKGGLLLGTSQYTLDRTPRVELIVIMHHPQEWLKDRLEAFQYLDSRARVLVFGHEHIQDIQKISNGNHEERLVIGSGAVTPENAAEPYIYRFNILEFTLNQIIAGEPCLEITIFPRVWIPERTRFDADTGRLSGKSSTTFKLPCPQFKLQAAMAPVPATAAPMIPAEDSDNFTRVNYFFWRYLSWQQRLTVIVQADILPTMIEAPRLQTVEHLALDRARAESKLGRLWDLIMPNVPAAKRELNPFTTQAK